MEKLFVFNNQGFAININTIIAVDIIEIKEEYASFKCYTNNINDNIKQVSFWYSFKEYKESKEVLIADLTQSRLEILKIINGDKPVKPLLKFKKKNV
jgi:hypothetical protein